MSTMTREKIIENAVCGYARGRDCIAYKFASPARRNVPDRMIVFPNGELIFIEFKAPGKKANAGQLREHERLILRHQKVYVVDNMDDGRHIIDYHWNKPLT